VLIPIDLEANSSALFCIYCHSSRYPDVFVNRVRDRFCNSDPVQDSAAVTAAHEGASKRYDRQIVDEALQGRIATGPPNAVEEDVAIANGGDEAIRAQTFDKQAMVLGP
jgi:hypothetical protein